MPKVHEESHKSDSTSFETSEAPPSKPEKASFESSAASSVDEQERKESTSVKRTSSSLSVESIVTEEKEIDETDIPKSESAESNPAISGFLQPKTSEKTKISPVKEFFSTLAKKFSLSTPPKKSPPKESPVSEEYIPGQELLDDCIVQIPLKHKKTQTSLKKTSSSPAKKAALFLSPETYDSSEASTSQSTTTDERDLITPSPTPRLEASKMTLAIKGHEPPKPEPGPFQKFKVLIGLKKEDKPATLPTVLSTEVKGEHETKATQTSSKLTSLIATEEVEALREFNRGSGSVVSTSESIDYSETSQDISVSSTESSSMNIEVPASLPQKSPVGEQAIATTSLESESLLSRASRLETAKEAFLKKMPNPLLKMLKHEDREDVEDEATPKSPRKKEPEDSPKSRPSFHKQACISESSSISEIQHEKMHVEETPVEATDDIHKKTEPPKDLDSASTSVDAEEMEIP